MNIFVVDRCPITAARMLCDQHVVKMVTESVQMLSTCHRVLDGVMTKEPSNSGKRIVPRYKLNDDRDLILYQAVHFNHPCNIWLRDDITHYDWLIAHTLTLCEEYTLRYKKTHACYKILEYMLHVGPPKNIPTYHAKWTSDTTFEIAPSSIVITDIKFVQAMPEEYKHEDVVTAYRNFYIGSKSKFARWKYRKPPKWYTDATTKPIRSVPALRSDQESLSYHI